MGAIQKVTSQAQSLGLDWASIEALDDQQLARLFYLESDMRSSGAFQLPDFVELLAIDRCTLPKGQYREAGFEARQVVDIDISQIVTDYRAQVLIDDSGQRFVAVLPKSITRPIQYGHQIKAHSVYLSQFQLLPCQRIQDYFQDQLGIP